MFRNLQDEFLSFPFHSFTSLPCGRAIYLRGEIFFKKISKGY